MTNLVPTYKVETDDFKVEYEVLSPIDIEDIKNPERRKIVLEMQNLDNQINSIEAEINKMDVEIDRLTNHADGFDYAVAVASGILTGLIDSFFVGDYNPNIEEIVTEFASKKAKKKGEKIDNYVDARKWLEKNAHMDHDGAYNKDPLFNKDSSASNGHTHRLDDLAHHPTLLGLAASIFFQFFRIAIFINNEGKLRPTFVKADMEQLAKVWAPAVISGIMIWLANVSEKYVEEELKEELPVPIKKIIKLIAASPMIIKILRCADSWYSHIMSDVGPRADGTDGKGIPGLFLSFLKEISVFIPSTRLHEAIQALYNSGTMNFDADLVIIKKMKKQAIPIIINEVIVRSFYFVRSLITEHKEHSNFADIDWKKTMPFGNRTVERMMTIAAGTFTAVDIADAAIRSGGFNPACLLRVNFVGVGRFAIAIVTDVGMGIKRNNLMYERINALSQQMALLNAKVSYKCAEVCIVESEVLEQQKQMWISAQNTEETLNAIYEQTKDNMYFFYDSLVEIQQNYEMISKYRNSIEEHNKGLKKDIINICKWGKK